MTVPRDPNLLLRLTLWGREYELFSNRAGWTGDDLKVVELLDVLTPEPTPDIPDWPHAVHVAVKEFFPRVQVTYQAREPHVEGRVY